MTGGFVPDNAIFVATNEGLAVALNLTTADPDTGSAVPLNLTGWTFASEVGAPPADPGVIATLEVTISDPPSLGQIVLSLAEDEVAALEPQEALYDIVATPPGGAPINLFSAPFIVLAGVTA